MPNHGYAARRSHPAALAIILGGHAALIAALVLLKMEIVRETPKTTDTYDVPIDQPPPVVPPPPEPKADPRRSEATPTITTVPPVIPNPFQGPVVEPSPTDNFDFEPAPLGPTDVTGPVIAPVLPPAPPEPTPLPKAAPTGVKPRGDPGSWVTNDDYPEAALRSEEQGRTAFRLEIAVSGKPSACTVTASSGSRTLDNAACRLLMRNARFTPGRDSDGQAVGGTYANSFMWKIPED